MKFTFVIQTGRVVADIHHMKKLAILATFVVLVSAISPAQEFPDAPQRQTPKMFWTMTGTYAASIIADGETTVAKTHQGCVEVWSPMLYGRQPNRARFYVASALVDGGTIYLSRKLVRSNRPMMRRIGWGLMSFGTEEHFRGAISNMRVNCN